MLLLTSTTDLVQVVTGQAVSTIYVHGSFVDLSAGVATPGRTNTQITTAATTNVVASPAASTQRNVRTLTVRNSNATASDDITIQHTDGTTVAQLFKYTLQAGETIQYFDEQGFSVLDATGQIKTAPGNVLTSPVINGTPTGTGIPTVTLKKGSGAGDYTTTSVTNTDVDATNLSFVVTIPTGWKLHITASGSATSNTAVTSVTLSLFDSTTLVDRQVNPPVAGVGGFEPFAMTWVVNGDGLSHTLKLQFRTANAANAAVVQNSSASSTPTMLFILTPSN